MRDAEFCLNVVKPDGCVAFHDANIIYRGLLRVLEGLERRGQLFRVLYLPDSIFVLELGNGKVSESAHVQELRASNYQGYLWSMMENDYYRERCKRPLARAAKYIDDKLFGLSKRLGLRPR